MNYYIITLLYLRRLLCNALIQPHFDYACSAWYPNLNTKLANKLQTTQNKCVRFCLQLGNRSHIGANEFEQINWLPVKERFIQCVCATVFKYLHNLSPVYMSELFSPSDQSTQTRNSTLKLVQPYKKTKWGQRGLSYIGPSVWNALTNDCKVISNLNTFKHALKKYFLVMVRNRESDIYKR